MAELDAHIRHLNAADEKLVRFTIGKASMESLAVANRRDFEDLAQDVLRGPDLRNILGYYSRSPGSGFYICEYGGLFVGLIALDVPSTSSDAERTDGKSASEDASPIAVIRHLYVDEPYRSTGVQEDLLSHALRVAFEANPALRVVKAHQSPLHPYVRQCLQDASFTFEENTQKVGVLRWQLDILKDVPSLVENLEVFDWTDCVPSYADSWVDPRGAILAAVEKASAGTLQVVIDSIDTLCSDVGSVSETCKFLGELYARIRARPIPSRLILHATRPSKLVPLLSQPSFSPSFTQLIAHPPVLLTHLAKDYLTPPPPASRKAKFWSAFLPLSERTHDVDRLVYGASGEGAGSATEIVVEILIRGGEGSGRKRGIERELEGWTLVDGPCDLTKLESLRGLWGKKTIEEAAPDPTQNVSFNLNLTSSQQEQRAQVPLPYAHEGKRHDDDDENNVPNATPAIFYDPDSADDIDDDDPDEDLDI
ncbi:hypothetical protein DXG03_007070 [Asterophora parasitica]|uniref:Elongator complex protein 5 n=1 Tax=Asterophora parasitica TaxID=117018 RepID=A0A9P7GEW5_9AGAR|nr:hypothetical protein DXG03_007070 [Asterophora parasitica]